jgi:glucokinase
MGKIVGIDLGGTNVRAAIVQGAEIIDINTTRVKSEGCVEDVLGQIYELIESLDTSDIEGIGMGVPGPVDDKKGIVYDLFNIPAWKIVHVKEIFEKKYNVPVWVQNDANCYAVAEKFHGKGIDKKSFIGLIVGTGMAGGVFINDKLYTGPNSMAGEFGMMKYLDKFYEYYSCGQFFSNVYGISGKEAYDLANQGDLKALEMWKEFGHHLGNAIESILYAYDPETIVLGGSVGKVLYMYEKYIWEVLENFIFKNSLKNFTIQASEIEDPGIIGAVALHRLYN